MLRPLPDLPPGVIGFEAVGEVTADDYREVLRPAVEAAVAAGPLRIVYLMGPEFVGYATGAYWEDTKMGLGHLGSWERIAVVTDVEWVEHLVSGFSWMVPGDLRRFPVDDHDEAIRWAAGIEPEPEPSRSPSWPLSRRRGRPRPGSSLPSPPLRRCLSSGLPIPRAATSTVGGTGGSGPNTSPTTACPRWTPWADRGRQA